MKITKFLGICVVLLAGGLLIPSAEARSLGKVWDELTEWGKEVLGDFTFGSILVDVIRKPKDTGVIKFDEMKVTPSGSDLDNIDSVKMSTYINSKDFYEVLGDLYPTDQQNNGSSSYQPDWTFYKEPDSVHYDRYWLSHIGRAVVHIGRPVGRNIMKSTDESPTSHVQVCVYDSLERESGSVEHRNELKEKLDLRDFIQAQQTQWLMEEQRLELYDPVRELSEMDHVCIQPMSELMPIDNSGNSN